MKVVLRTSWGFTQHEESRRARHQVLEPWNWVFSHSQLPEAAKSGAIADGLSRYHYPEERCISGAFAGRPMDQVPITGGGEAQAPSRFFSIS